MKAKFINPFTDFGFKKIFGEEASKPLLLDFLNALLPEKDKLASLSFKNNEKIGQIEYDRKAIFDIYCENEKGEKIIVEMQKAKQNYFKERTIFYSTFPIQEQAEKQDWNFNLKAVYCIGILDFTFDDYETEAEKSEVIHTIKLKNQNGKIFYDKLTFIYLEMPNFKKVETELKHRLEKWLYFIKHLGDFDSIPKIFDNEDIFSKAFEKAEIANYNSDELHSYERSLKYYRDLKNVIDTSFVEGKVEGLQEGEIKGVKKGIEKGIKKGEKKRDYEIAKKGMQMGMKIKDIADLTGLSEEEIKKL